MNPGDIRFQCTGCHALVVFSYGQTLREIADWMLRHEREIHSFSGNCALRVARDQS